MKVLLVVLALSLLIMGCEEIKEFFELDDDKEVPYTPPPEPVWAPNRSNKYTVTGLVNDADMGIGIGDVKITATYTIACPTSACEPFTETIETSTDSGGKYTLELYEQFWDITFQRTAYNFEKHHLTKEQTAESNGTVLNIELKMGMIKEYVGYPRDQGKRFIIDRGGTGGYAVNFGGVGHFYQYLVVINNPESETFKRLRMLNNKQIWFKGYVSPLENEQASIELIEFYTI